MNDQNIKYEQEQFEKRFWGSNLRKKDGEYVDEHVADMWEGWLERAVWQRGNA